VKRRRLFATIIIGFIVVLLAWFILVRAGYDPTKREIRSDAEIEEVKMQVLAKPVSADLQEHLAGSVEIHLVSKTDVRRTAESIHREHGLGEHGVLTLLEFIDKVIAGQDQSARTAALEVLAALYSLIPEERVRSLVAASEARKIIVLDLLESGYQPERVRSFQVLALHFIDQDRVAESMVDALSNDAFNTSFERLDKVRALTGRTDESNVIRRYLVEVVNDYRRYLGGSSRAIPVESALILSYSEDPPAEIVGSIIEMLRVDELFGSPALLQALSNMGDLAIPFLPELKLLQEEVEERIVNGRNRQGSGDTSFSREQFERMLRDIED
jgi:hypothetical protein